MHLRSNHDVHVWRIALDRFSKNDVEMLEVLSCDEQNRAERTKHIPTRDCFIRSHFALRHILSRYINVSPERIEFSFQPRGKPEVDGLEFSLSHSDDIAMVAIAGATKLGIDVEAVRPIEKLEDLARRFLTADEANEVFAAPSKLDRFFEVWTKKEAIAKATGAGLCGLESSPPGFKLYPLVVPRGYVAALAVEGSVVNLQYFDYLSIV